jgi:GYF domain 2
MREIFIHRDGKDEGPYTLEQLQAHLVVGTLSDKDVAWYEGLTDWIPLSAAITNLEKDPSAPSDDWRRRVATTDQRNELRFLGLKVKRDLTQGEYSDLVTKAGTDPEVESRLGNFRLKKNKEAEFMIFLRAECFRLRMNVPSLGTVRETIDFLSESIPNWNTETSSEEFAKLLIKRYPELRFEWTDPDDENAELESEAATGKQISYLKALGAPIPPSLGIREASDLIEKWKYRASDAQKRRLNFYRLDYDRDITKEQATQLIDYYKANHPESEDAYQEWKIKNGIS